MMARKLRLQYAGAIYHVMSRGNQQQAIVRIDADRQLLLQTLSEAGAKTGWQIHAYCIMRTHFHLVVETPQANLVSGMKWFLGTYTSRFNRRHKLFGHLFSGRYQALFVDGSGNGYLKTVCDYVHYGAELQESAEAKANRILGQALQHLGWAEVELSQRRKGDLEKVRLAEQLRRETTMTLEWIARRLHMGTKTYLSHLLYWRNREGRMKESKS
jgi:REP element-mobilizing transposase RayT